MILLKSFVRRHMRSVTSGLLSLIFAALLVFLACMTLFYIDSYTYKLRVVSNGNLNELITCSLSIFPNPDDKMIQKTKDAILALPSVESCYTPSYMQADDVKTGNYFNIDTYSPTLKDVRYSLASGTWPAADSFNQIVLPYTLASVYKDGQKILVEVVDLGSHETRTVELTITGFLTKDTPILKFLSVSNTDNLEDIFSTDYPFGIVYGLKDTNGEKIQSIDFRNCFIIKPTQGYTKQKITEDLRSVHGSSGTIHFMPDMIEGYHLSNRESLRKTIGYAIITFTLTLTTIFASTMLRILNGQKKMSVYYLCGAPWAKSIRIELFEYLPYLLAGFCLGIYSYTHYDPGLYSFSWEYAALSFLLIAVIIGIAVIPFFLATKSKSPLALYRKD